MVSPFFQRSFRGLPQARKATSTNPTSGEPKPPEYDDTPDQPPLKTRLGPRAQRNSVGHFLEPAGVPLQQASRLRRVSEPSLNQSAPQPPGNYPVPPVRGPEGSGTFRGGAPPFVSRRGGSVIGSSGLRANPPPFTPPFTPDRNHHHDGRSLWGTEGGEGFVAGADSDSGSVGSRTERPRAPLLRGDEVPPSSDAVRASPTVRAVRAVPWDDAEDDDWTTSNEQAPPDNGDYDDIWE
eukprot:638404-Prorocentrum_minimum.AAC.1